MIKKVMLVLILVGNLYASIEDEVDAKRFEHKNGTLIDHFSGMQWQDNDESKSTKKTWKDAKNYCSTLTLDGKSDWRLPSLSELRYLVDFRDKLHKLPTDTYWSSEDFYHSGASSSGMEARVVRFGLSGYSWRSYGKVDDFYIDAKMNVRCIKGNKYTKLTYINSRVEQTRIDQINNAYEMEYNKQKEIGTVRAYKLFIKSYPNAPQIKDAQDKISIIAYGKAIKQWKIQPLVNFIHEYPESTFVEYAIEDIYKFVKNKNNIQDYIWFVKEFPNTHQTQETRKKIYRLEFVNVENQDNISGYEWFIKTYPKAS